ncbi:MAG: hypothetical protein O3C59_12205 [Proteobacteria bacterium]|nr:hypothetical protein [Pseudomonadota bacterium]
MIDMKTESEDLAQADRTVARAYKALEVAVELLESALDAARTAPKGCLAYSDWSGLIVSA